jgi:hypothetical protein
MSIVVEVGGARSRMPNMRTKIMRSRCCPCVCVFLCVSGYPPLSMLGKSPLILSRQRLGKNSHNFLCISWDHLAACVCPHNCFVFYAVRVVSKESRRLFLPRTSRFLCSHDASYPLRYSVPYFLFRCRSMSSRFHTQLSYKLVWVDVRFFMRICGEKLEVISQFKNW